MNQNSSNSLSDPARILGVLAVCAAALPMQAQAQNFGLEPVGETELIAPATSGGLDGFTHGSALSVSANGDIGFAHNTLSQNRQQFWYSLLSPEGVLERLELGSSQRLDVSSPGVSLTDDDFALVTLPTGNGNDLRMLGISHQRGLMFPSGSSNSGLDVATDSLRLNFAQEDCEIIGLSVPNQLPNRISNTTGRSSGTLPVAVECEDTRLVGADIRADAGSDILDLRRRSDLTPVRPNAGASAATDKGTGKAYSSPPWTITSGMAMGVREGGKPTLLYAGRGEVFPGNFPIVVEYDGVGGVSRIREMLEQEVLDQANPGMSLCGHRQQEQYWLSFIDDDHRVAIVRINDDVEEYRYLGTTLGPIDLACDPWGNVVISWWGSTTSGTAIFVAAIDQFGQLSGIDSFPVVNNVSQLSLNVGLNADGDAAVAWSDGVNGITLQRYRLNASAVIDGSFMGSYFNPYFNGEGFIFDVALVGGVPSVVVYYFTYDNDGSGHQAWVVGSGPIDLNRFTAEVALGSGGEFGEDFDPRDVTLTLWGTVHVRWLGCGLIRIEMESDLYPDFGYLAQPLTGIPVGGSGRCAGGLEPPVREPLRGVLPGDIDATFAGSWFDPGRNGEGLVYDITETASGPVLVLYYFTYADDGSGRQAWLVGAAPIVDDKAVVQVAYGSGATFGPGFDPSDVSLIPAGSITVTFDSCVQALVEYNGAWGMVSFFTLPLTAPPIGFSGTCSPALN